MASQPDWRTVAAQAGAVLVAVSGGADSVYLCHHLRAHIPQRSMRFVIAHINHRTRGTESDVDENFVRELARQFDWEFHAPRIDPAWLSPKPNENDLREARIALLKSLAGALGISVIAFGHHANDLAEGFLLAALRGSGPRGLAAMTTVRTTDDGMTLIRPLLGLMRGEIETQLVELKQSWRNDATNLEKHAKRNFLRHEVLPLLSQREPSALHNIAESAHIAAEVDAVYGLAVDAARRQVTLAETKDEILFSIPLLRTQDPALVPGVIRAFASSILASSRSRTGPALPKRETLRDVCARVAITDGDETTFPLVEEISTWLSNEYGLIFRYMNDSSLKNSFMHLKKALPVLLMEGETISLTDDASPIHARVITSARCSFNDDGHRTAWIDRAQATGELVLRRAGNEERVFTGEGTSKSVGKYLQEHRIPRVLREDVAAVCDDAGILWIPQLARSKRALVSSTTEHVLQLTVR